MTQPWNIVMTRILEHYVNAVTEAGTCPSRASRAVAHSLCPPPPPPCLPLPRLRRRLLIN